MNKVIKDIISSLQLLKDQKRYELAQYYYPTSMKVIGVTVPNLRTVLKELKQTTKEFTPQEKIALAKELVEQNIYECQHLAYDYIGKDKKTLKHLSKKDIKDLGQNMDNWVSTDCFSVMILGYAWRNGIISKSDIDRMIQSKDLWQRRMALVATVGLNQKSNGGTGDVEQTLYVCEALVRDKEDMVIKALSWALRELAKVDPKPVKDFMDTYKQVLAKRVIREVTNKLVHGLKNVKK